MSSDVSEENVSFFTVEEYVNNNTSIKQAVSSAVFAAYFMRISYFCCYFILKMEVKYYVES
jgi:hypothetical protein